MSVEDGPTDFRAVSAAKFPEDEESNWSTSTEFARLLIAPIAVMLLLAGGVYWIRLLPPAGEARGEQASTIQVRLIPHPDPVPIPAAVPSQAVANNVVERASPSHAEQEDDTPVTAPQAPAAVPSQVVSSLATESPATTTAPPSKAIALFQQALLRHIGRYRRYPAAARQNHLQGTVQTFFSLRRDGTVLDVWVEAGSGQPVLDREAIATVRRAQPLPPIPPDLPDHLNIQVLLAFDPF